MLDEEAGMRIVVAYDVAVSSDGGAGRLRRVAKACKNYGTRVQFSVFECAVGQSEWLKLRERLLDIVEPELDSVRFYFLGENEASKTEHHGVRVPIDMDGPLVV